MKRLIDFLIGVPGVWFLSLFAKRRSDSKRIPERILVIKLAAVGDTVLLVPVLRALRHAFPEAKIDWLVSPINVSIAQTVPYVDQAFVGRFSTPLALWRLVRILRGKRYDAVLDFEQWARGTALLSYFSGAPIRLGFSVPGQYRASLYTATFPKKYEAHEIDDFFGLGSLLTPLSNDRALELWETEQGIAEVDEKVSFLKKGEKGRLRVLIHPGCGIDGFPREWPLSNYAVLGNWLIKNYTADIVLTAGPEEIKKSRDLMRLLNGQAHDLGGQLSWMGTISLLKKVDLVISGNTGVMHLAAALRIPQVALHGPTNSRLWGPLNEKARVVQSDCPHCPCLKLGFEYHRNDQSCMQQIAIEPVKSAIRSLVDNRQRV